MLEIVTEPPLKALPRVSYVLKPPSTRTDQNMSLRVYKFLNLNFYCIVVESSYPRIGYTFIFRHRIQCGHSQGWSVSQYLLQSYLCLSLHCS